MGAQAGAGDDDHDNLWCDTGGAREVEAGLPISVVAAQLGIDTATLRAWHRRYGLGPSTRSPGGHRRYTPQDVRRLHGVRALTATGVTMAEAARVMLAVPPVDLPPALGRLSDNDAIGSDTPAAALQQAALSLDGPAVVRLLHHHLAGHGSCPTWEELVRPALRAVDSCGRPRGQRVAAEHLLTHLVTAAFAAHTSTTMPIHPAATPSDVSHRVLLACAPTEQHSLPLIALAGALAETGIRADILGARTPRHALTTTTRTHPHTTVLVLCLRPHAADVGVFDRPPGNSTWIAAGPGWTTKHLPPGIARVDGLDHATKLIQTASKN